MNIKKNDHLHETFSRIAGNTRGKVMTDQEESVHLLKENMQECIPFQGLGDMIMKMDRIYDLLDYPQTELKIREWDDSEKWTGTPLENDDDWNYGADAAEKFHELTTGNNPSVYVETRFRRYGSWQGILQAGKRKLSYRSALEFLHYIMGYIKG